MGPGRWILSSFLPFLCLGLCSCRATITPNQPIKDGGEQLVSDGENFTLGFFSPGRSRQRYVGIWYSKVGERTVVWVANRDNPINGTSGVVSINKDGNLVIYKDDIQSVPVWQTNVSTAKTRSNNYSARILDSGNLALFQGRTSTVVWQSFDYPTHALLPGVKLGLDRLTGINRLLTSWKSRDDPGTGEYSYGVDTTGSPQLVLQRGSTRLFRTLPWSADKWILKPAAPLFIFKPSYIVNQDEVSMSYSLVNSSVVSMMYLDESGYIQMVSWVETKWVGFYTFPKDQCDNYGHCGVFGYCDPSNGVEFECSCLPGYEPRSAADWFLRDGSGGCGRKRTTEGMCRNGEGFVTFGSAKLPDVTTARLVVNLGADACKEECLRNCSCTAYSIGGGSGGECITWYGDLMDVRKYNGGFDLHVRVDATALAQYSKKSRRLRREKVAVVVTLSVTVISVLIIFLICSLARKKKRKVAGLILDARDEENLELLNFDMDTISEATNKFSDRNVIGEGGFGPVYKGQLSTGKDVAVKRLSMESKQGLIEFKNEVILIAKLQHRNLVRLLGCCIHGEERMLVYEYMPNGSLDSFIFDAFIISRSRGQNK